MNKPSSPAHPDLGRLPDRTRRDLERFARAALITPEDLVDRVLTAHFRTFEGGDADEADRSPPGSDLSHFSSSDGPLLSRFLRHRLRGALSYDRIAGYFRSSLLPSVRDLLSSIQSYRVLCNADLEEADLEVARLAACGRPLSDHLQETRYRVLHELLSRGIMEVRVVGGPGLALLHMKAGLIRYPDGRSCAFLGSVNETFPGWSMNEEALWCSEEDKPAGWVRSEFDRFWDGAIPIGDAVRSVPGSETPSSDVAVPGWISDMASTFLTGFDPTRAVKAPRRSGKRTADQNTADLFTYEPNRSVAVQDSVRDKPVISTPSVETDLFSNPGAATVPARDPETPMPVDPQKTIFYPDRIVPEYEKISRPPETPATQGPHISITDLHETPRSRVTSGSRVEYETIDPVTLGPKRLRVFIMRSKDDKITEKGVQSIGNATPVALALLGAELGEEVLLDPGGPSERSLRIINIW